MTGTNTNVNSGELEPKAPPSVANTVEKPKFIEIKKSASAKEGIDIMGAIKVYIKKEGGILDNYAFDTEAVNESDIIKEFGLSEAVSEDIKNGEIEISEEAKNLILQGEFKKAQDLCVQQIDKAGVIVSDNIRVEQFFENLNHFNDVLIKGTFGGLRRIAKGGKEELFKMFSQSFEGEKTHNEVLDNRADDKLSNHDVYVLTPQAKVKLEAEISGLGDKYRIIGKENSPVFILQIHNKSIPFVCAEFGNGAANDNKESSIDNKGAANDNKEVLQPPATAKAV